MRAMSVVDIGCFAACVLLVGFGAGAGYAGDRHAGLSAYGIFSGTAPRPPRAVPNATPSAAPSAKIDHPAATASKPVRTNVPTPNAAAVNVPVHPTASMFPAVAPLE